MKKIKNLSPKKIENLVEKYNKKSQKDATTSEEEEEDSSDHGNDVWK